MLEKKPNRTFEILVFVHPARWGCMYEFYDGSIKSEPNVDVTE